MDDTLIHSKGSFASHLDHVRLALQKLRLRSAKLYRNPYNFSFSTDMTLYMGCEISLFRVQCRTNDIFTIYKFPRPKTLRQVRSCMGMCSSWKFIPDSIENIIPVYALAGGTPSKLAQKCRNHRLTSYHLFLIMKHARKHLKT